MILEGCSKYEVFKVPMADQWLVVVNGRNMNDELRKYPDDVLSVTEARRCGIQNEYTLGNSHPDATFVTCIGGSLTSKLGHVLGDIVDEMIVTFNDLLAGAEEDWQSVPALRTMNKLTASVTNRVFVGLPFCRDKAMLENAMGFASDVVKTRNILNIFPDMLKPFIGYWPPWAPARRRKMAELLGDAVRERREQIIRLGSEYKGKHDDFLSWVIEEDLKTRGEGESIDGVMEVIMASNLAAIHAMGLALTHALYDLCAMPQYIEPLRQEAEAKIKQFGWTKDALDAMWKADSFFKEGLRLNGPHQMAFFRKSMKDVVLSNGTLIPAGTLVAATNNGTHLQEQFYKDAAEFRPFRFSDIREKGGAEAQKQPFHATSPEYVIFGHGRHACLGRWFAAIEMKAVLAYILLNYDLKLEKPGGRPENLCLEATVVANPWAKVMFRKRKGTTV